MNKYIAEFNEFSEAWISNNLPSSDRQHEPGSPLGVMSFHKNLYEKIKEANDHFLAKVNELLSKADDEKYTQQKELKDELQLLGVEKINHFIARAKGE